MTLGNFGRRSQGADANNRTGCGVKPTGKKNGWKKSYPDVVENQKESKDCQVCMEQAATLQC